MVPAIMTIAVVPFGSTLLGVPMVIADINVGVLYVFAISSLGVYGIVIAGWSSNSKYPFLGGVRSSSQMISYELSLGLAVIPIFLLVGQLRLTTIVRYQIEHGWMIAPFIGRLDRWSGNGSSPSRCSSRSSFSRSRFSRKRIASRSICPRPKPSWSAVITPNTAR